MSLSRQKYINIQNQHFTVILNMIDHSTLHEDLELITRSLFHRNICTIKTCETGIFSSKEPTGTTITVHREILELQPNENFLIQCEVIKSTHISAFHNLVGQEILTGTLIVNNKIVHEQILKNRSFVNSELRQLKQEEIHLNNFIVFGNHLQCLKRGHLNLNGLESLCKYLSLEKIS